MLTSPRARLSAIAVVASVLFAPPNAFPSDSWERLTQPITETLEGLANVPGAMLVILQDGRVMYERSWGSVDRSTQMRLASATKFLSAVTLMRLIDSEKLDAAAPAGDFMPAFFPPGTPKGAMTITHMFSHTTGLPAQSAFISDLSITLEEAANLIGAQTPLLAFPGTQLRYGGVSMQVAGRIAEIASGLSWNELFETEVVRPLGMSHTNYAAFGETLNPRIGGGAQSTADDVLRLLTMLAARGIHEGGTFLSREAVDFMLGDRTAGAAPVMLPGSLATYYGYGMGCWIEAVDPDTGVPTEFTSPGAFGSTPWVHPELGIAGVFMVEHQLAAFDPLIDPIREYARHRARCARSGDLNVDGTIDLSDLLPLLASWGTDDSAADLNGDGAVDLADLLTLLAAWGPCPGLCPECP